MPTSLFYPAIATGLVLALLVSIYTDLKTREISNWVVVAASVWGLLVWTVFHGFSGLGTSAAGGFASFSIFLLMAMLGNLGMGDVKLMGAMGCLLGWPLAITGVLHTVISGSVFAILWVLFSKKLWTTLKNLYTITVSWLLPGRKRVQLQELETSSLPYGVAIAVGGIWTLAAVKIPAFDLFRLIF
ncbi:MAG: prepilin peptidase [Deltaproteobacteria bacterium]|nr:prepilin peptidase [Deltaproteobacteria bacterium]